MTDRNGTIDVAILRLPLDYAELNRLKAPPSMKMLAITNDAVFDQIDFRDFPSLQRIALTELALTPEAIALLTVLPKLNYVCITSFQQDPTASLPALTQISNLRHLVLRSHQLNSVDQVPTLKSLQTLEIESSNIDEQSLAELQKRMPNCEIDYRPNDSGGRGTDRETLSLLWQR